MRYKSECFLRSLNSAFSKARDCATTTNYLETLTPLEKYAIAFDRLDSALANGWSFVRWVESPWSIAVLPHLRGLLSAVEADSDCVRSVRLIFAVARTIDEAVVLAGEERDARSEDRLLELRLMYLEARAALTCIVEGWFKLQGRS